VTELRKQRGQIPLKSVCSAFGKSRQAYYKALKRKALLESEENRIIELVQGIRQKLSYIGGRKLYFMLSDKLKSEGIHIGRDKFFDVLRKHGELVFRGRRYPLTTNSRHHFAKYRNIFKGLDISRPEQVFVSDITYISLVGNRFVYAAFTTDAFTRRIMGFNVSEKLDAQLAIEALIMAISNREYSGELIHHSDRGVQFCSNEFIDILRANNIAISMTETGDPRDNAIAERINGIIKHEFGLNRPVKSLEEANQLISQAVILYNNLRPHMSCKYLTPSQMHLTTNFAYMMAVKK